jgi:hypothetical protein
VNLSGVSVPFLAYHTDLTGGEGRHRHTWVVKAMWLITDPVTDLRDKRRDLRELLKRLAPFSDHTRAHEFPAQLWSAEAIAAAVLREMGCARVDIDRTGFHVERWRDS